MKLKQFLIYLGVFIFVVGVLGFFVWGPDPVNSVFGQRLYFSNWENWSWMIVGALVFLLALIFSWVALRFVALVLAGLFVFAGTYAFFQERLGQLALQKPIDGIIYLVLGLVVFAVLLLIKRPAKKS